MTFSSNLSARIWTQAATYLHDASTAEYTSIVGAEGFVKLGQFEIDKLSGRNTWAYPVVTGGRLYLRDQNYLVGYDVKGN